MPRFRPAFMGLVAFAWLALAGCSMPHLMGMGSYYEVIDTATGKVYYADQVEQQERGVVEFRDGASDAWISLPAAEVKEISEAEFLANTRK